ncbi:3'-5' exonuclease [Alteromonas aestuariivivens]|uniref:3'-5' exonuclease n=1 Tax=Alteromonas aestuariivivens TaxID=1938339 RepID=A0A3D8M3H6_9ALTE|nr:3'-5' exonuclease [Alteromonas aestuariivivens]
MFDWFRLKHWFSYRATLPDAWQQQRLFEAPLLAIDLELTSLNPEQSKITSIGWLEGQNGSINLESAYYRVVRVKGDLQQSPVIHGLTPEHTELGEHVRDSLNALSQFARSHIWVFHNASLDVRVLNRAFAANNLQVEQVVTLDTLKLAMYQLKKTHELLPSNSMTLANCRQRMGLPAVPAHNALDDAMATLQLWFAQFHQLAGRNSITIDAILHTRCINVVNLGKKCKRGIDKVS